MERNLLLQDKRGVSLMIGYVLLIAIAVALSTGVFFYLKLYLPSDKPECYTDVDLTIDEVRCMSSGGGYEVYVNVTNRGLFSVDSAYIKIGDSERVFKRTLNEVEGSWSPTTNPISTGECTIGNELKPGEKFCGRYNYPQTSNPISPGTLQEISIEPLLYIDNTPVLCPQGVVEKTVICT